MPNVVPPASVKNLLTTLFNTIRHHVLSIHGRVPLGRVAAWTGGVAVLAGLFALAPTAPAALSPASVTQPVAAAEAVTKAVTESATTTKASPKKAVKAKKASSTPSTKSLGSPKGNQVGDTPSKEQMRNAREIIKAGQQMKLPPRAWVIALATASQESNMVNLGDLGSANDHDSLGLFQQRPSSGWGSASQVRDPNYSAKSFYRALKQVSGWKTMSLTDAAQKVQVSAFPDAYAKWEKHAINLVLATYGDGPYAKIAARS